MSILFRTDRKYNVSAQLSHPVWVITKLTVCKKFIDELCLRAVGPPASPTVSVCAQNRALPPLPPPHGSRGSVHQLQYRELEVVSSRRLSPQEVGNQAHTTNEETVIEAQTNTHSLSWMPITQMVPAVNTHTLSKHSIEQNFSFL